MLARQWTRNRHLRLPFQLAPNRWLIPPHQTLIPETTAWRTMKRSMDRTPPRLRRRCLFRHSSAHRFGREQP